MDEQLTQAKQLLEDSSTELQEEGIGNLTYWLARTGIDRDDYHQFAAQEIEAALTAAMFRESLSADQQILALFSLGFLFGLLVGRNHESDEL